MYNKFKINGLIEPIDDDIKELDGLTFDKLPQRIKTDLNGMPFEYLRLLNTIRESPVNYSTD